MRVRSLLPLNQTVYERPSVGGFAARLPRGIGKDYERVPALGALFRLSAGRPLTGSDRALDPALAAQHLGSRGIRFLVLNRDLASGELSAFVEHSIALREIARDDHRTIYEVID